MKRLLILAVVGLMLGACNGDGEDAGTSTPGNTNPNAIRSDVPEDFPVPIPDGGDVQSAARQESGDGFSYGALITFEDGRYEELIEFYDDWAGSLPEELQRTDITAERPGVTWTDTDSGLLVTVSQNPASVTLAVTVPPGAL